VEDASIVGAGGLDLESCAVKRRVKGRGVLFFNNTLPAHTKSYLRATFGPEGRDGNYRVHFRSL
jgi:hypothetical protein